MKFIINSKKKFFFVTNLFIASVYFYQFLKTENFTFNDLQFESKSKNWIVLTSINNVTDQVRKLSTTKSFQLLVVGDLKSNPTWSLNNAIFLNIESQKSFNFKSFKTTPFNSYTRKNMGYLYAIKMGAQFIYDTDDDNAPTVDLEEYFNFEDSDHGLIFDCDSPKILNPYAHFGQPLIWPRGYPLTEIHKNHYNNFVCGHRKSSVVQQGVVNGDPDVDAIFRLTKTMNYKKLNISFDSTAPSIQYPIYRMAPYNSQNTFFHYRAFWSLYLPHTVTFRLTDIWRSYWAQRLMWLLDDTVSFLGPNAYQLRNSHSYLKDFEEEQAMYLKTNDLVNFLFEWKCLKTSFYSCVLDLSTQMANRNFWLHDEVNSIENWLSDLTQIGYVEPEIVNFEHESITNLNCTNTFHNINEMVKFHRYNSNEIEYIPVRYTPEFKKSGDVDNYCCEGQMDVKNTKLDNLLYFDRFCRKSGVKLDLNMSSVAVNDDPLQISLLITFNHEPNSLIIEFLQKFYMGFFRNIIFCGDKRISDVLNESRSRFKRFDSFTFIEIYDMHKGFFHYYCMTKAIELNLNTKGILLISDDVLVSPPLMRKLNTSKIWFHYFIKCDTEFMLKNSLYEKWIWWSDENLGYAALNNLWKYFEQTNKGMDSLESNILRDFLFVLDSNKENKNESLQICVSGSDLFYLPKEKFDNFHFMSKLFRKYKVFLEIAVPTLLAGLVPKSDVEIMYGYYAWFEKRMDTNLDTFIHPVKILKMIATENGTQFCKLLKMENSNIYAENIQKIRFPDS